MTNTEQNTNLAEYWDQLNGHDWYYEFSDDHRVWRSGNNEHDRLRTIAGQSPKHQALYDGFMYHHFSGDAWGTEISPKPERPVDTEKSNGA